MSRYPPVVYEAVPLDGETPKEATARRGRNRVSREAARVWNSARCRCGEVQGHVSHNVNPEDRWEGPDYYAGMTLHEFWPAGLEKR